jgi:hypothetical protein
MKAMTKKMIALVVFGMAFGFVEAAVVYYLRTLLGLNSNFVPQQSYKQILNLGFIAFLTPGSIILPNIEIAHAEALREIATLIMLGAISFLASDKLRTRLAAFLISFATWDIFYYVFLHFLTGWPMTMMDIDVFFLDPIPWVGPVITAGVISLLLLVAGIKIFIESEK